MKYFRGIYDNENQINQLMRQGITFKALVPISVFETYNFHDIDKNSEPWMVKQRYTFTMIKQNIRPDKGPYADDVVFSLMEERAYIMYPFNFITSGVIVSTAIDSIFQKLKLADYVRYPVFIMENGILKTWHYYYFYKSYIEYVDLEKSRFVWTVPGSVKRDKVTGEKTWEVIGPAHDITYEHLRLITNIMDSKVLRCEKFVLKPEIAMYDIFELDVWPNRIYLSQRAVDFLNQPEWNLDIRPSNTCIE